MFGSRIQLGWTKLTSPSKTPPRSKRARATSSAQENIFASPHFANAPAAVPLQWNPRSPTKVQRGSRTTARDREVLIEHHTSVFEQQEDEERANNIKAKKERLSQVIETVANVGYASFGEMVKEYLSTTDRAHSVQATSTVKHHGTEILNLIHARDAPSEK